jgi:hypothetical protein
MFHNAPVSSWDTCTGVYREVRNGNRLISKIKLICVTGIVLLSVKLFLDGFQNLQN